MKGFLDYLDDLCCDAPEEMQEEAISFLVDACRKRASRLSLVVQTTTKKKMWDNEAKIVCALDDWALEVYIQRLLEWLQDLNWPGSELIFNRLVVMESPLLDLLIQHARQWAARDNHLGWISVLADLAVEREKRGSRHMKDGNNTIQS